MNFYPQSSIVIVGQNPEMADITNPRGDLFGLSWVVVAANERGDTREMPARSERDAVLQAGALQCRWNTLARLPVAFDRWHQGRALYGSEAYVAYGQDDDLALEARELEDERWS